MAYPFRRFLRHALPVLMLLFAATATLLIGYLLGRNRPLPPTRNRIQARVLNVQHGEATLLRTGSGKFIVIGAGPAGQGATVNAALKDAGAERIALLVLPYPLPEASGGAEDILNAFPVDEVLTPGMPPTQAWQERLEKKLAAKNIPVKAGRAGEVMTVDGIRIEILAPAEPLLTAPPPAANNSLVLRLVWGDTRFLFAGGIGAKGENALIARQPDMEAQWLHVARFGSREATSPEFLRLVDPEQIVLSVGPNKEGLPHPETLMRIEATGAHVYRTDTADDRPLTFISDGVQITGPN